MSWLGWVGGVIVLVLFFWITLWSSLLLSDMYEVDGVKHPTYRSAVLHILGEPCQPQQQVLGRCTAKASRQQAGGSCLGSHYQAGGARMLCQGCHSSQGTMPAGGTSRPQAPAEAVVSSSLVVEASGS
jgi:hypothetical protein